MMHGLVSTGDSKVDLWLRMTLAVVMFPHGAQKMLGWFGGPGFGGAMTHLTAGYGLPAPVAFAVIVIEFFAPLALVFGLFSRIAAAAIAALMIGAVLTQHLPYGFFMDWFGTQGGEGFEYHLLVVGLAAAVMANGSGAVSLDRVISVSGSCDRSVESSVVGCRHAIRTQTKAGSTMFSNACRQASFVAAATVATLGSAAPAMAQVEVEADPIAYALGGYSLHVAKILGATRLNVGVFGADVPEAFHGNDGWTTRIRGAGIKFDYVGSDPNGLFAGFGGAVTRINFTVDGAVGEETKDRVGIGVRGGYRLPVGGAGLYVAPWVGVSYSFGEDVVIGAERFEHRNIQVFPTVHIGWRF